MTTTDLLRSRAAQEEATPITNTLYYGDNLDILRRYIKDDTVDLVYLDPPFNSNATYNVLFAEQDGTRAASQIKAFDDTWKWDQAASKAYQDTVVAGGKLSDAMQAFRQILGDSNMLAYLAMMAPRLAELRRVLKPTGSIYLHCDTTASHYLKLLMDAVFGAEAFRNEIVWNYGGRGAKAVAKQFPRNHDVLLMYRRAMGHDYVPQYEHRTFTLAEARAKGFRVDDAGRWFKTAPRGDYTDASVAKLESEGRIHWTKNGSVRVKYFLPVENGLVTEDSLIGDVWSDIGDAMHMGAERLGYPTQKPQALLERIISASSNPGDVVLDPFCGCGTAVAAAQQLGRAWIGIDITHLAINLMKVRIKDAFGDTAKFQVIGEPVSLPDAQALAASDPYQFQWWALGLVGARPAEGKKGADKGIDGRLVFIDGPKNVTQQIIFSVKAGKLQAPFVRDLRGVIEREKAAIGVLLTMAEPTQHMRSEAASAGLYHSDGWNRDYPRLQIISVGDLLAGRKMVEMPPLGQVSVTYKKAPKAKTEPGAHAPELPGLG